MSKVNEHMEPFSRIGRRLREEGNGVGLSLMQFVLHPDIDGEHNTAVGIFLLDEEAPKDVTVKMKADPEFDRMISDQKRAEEDEKARNARKELEGLQDDLRNPNKGLGLDDD